MRANFLNYFWTVHTIYLYHDLHTPPAQCGALPLVTATELTVVAAAARRLHLVATTDALPVPHGPEVEVADEHLGTRWRLRFFDSSVLPDLGILTEDTPEEV